MKLHEPKSVSEAIGDLQTFLEEDMWTKFYPKTILPGMKNGKKVNCVFSRQDVFKNEKEFRDYLNDHFNILRKEIRKLGRQRK
jgi:hypothetical protein